MCYRAAEFLPSEAARDLTELAALGWLANEKSEHVLCVIDPIDGDKASSGVEVRQHPKVMIAQQPELWRLIDEFWVGARRRVRPSDYATRSNFEIEATLIQRAAHQRELPRELERLRLEREREGK